MIYIGTFFQITNEEEDSEKRHGEFNMIVEADDKGTAIEKFKKRILRFRETSKFFEGSCSIYFVQLLEFEGLPAQEAMMLNYKSYAGEPILPFIGCSIPSEESDRCRIYDWQNNIPEIDGRQEHLFLKFEV